MVEQIMNLISKINFTTDKRFYFYEDEKSCGVAGELRKNGVTVENYEFRTLFSQHKTHNKAYRACYEFLKAIV